MAIFCGRIAAGQQPIIYGDGKATRDYVHVADVADAFVAAADHAPPGIWNIGTGQENSVLDLLALVGAAACRQVEPRFEAARPGELQRSALDSTAAERYLGWHAHIPLVDGIADVYAWVQADQTAP
ncbi:GDP-mannose 4,6-dehydratase [Nonomuraea ceibae]|uniref:GDP-mannose 4,6-dehydratase n=1 Tax=Nonomuraea ceibae TaxID=1935170 RepID=UPI003557462A